MSFDWRNTWLDAPSELLPLEGRRGSGERAGQIGLAQFSEGGSFYPACSSHGAMNCVKPADEETGSFWRCLTDGCNIGTEFEAGHSQDERVA